MTDRFERLTNLAATLLDTRRPLTLEEILERVPGYPEERESARRQFERDKDALRTIGIPLELAEDGYGEFVGYRVDHRAYELPEMDLTADERAALHAAVTAVRLDGGQGRQALWKLGGLDGEEQPLVGALASDELLPDLVEACRTRAPVTFEHRGRQRHLDPYAVLFRSGYWYVLGHDHDREQTRSYRTDRIVGPITPGQAGSFERPEGFDPETVLHDEPWRYGEDPPLEALVAVDPVVAPWVRQQLGEAAVVRSEADGALEVRMTVTNRDAFRSFVFGLLDHAVVLEPAELRQDVIDWLEGMVAAGGSSRGGAA